MNPMPRMTLDIDDAIELTEMLQFIVDWIDADDMPRLFTRFGRIATAATSHLPGTGLGLYLSRELARLHGGDITVESKPGHGSTFTLQLPTTLP